MTQNNEINIRIRKKHLAIAFIAVAAISLIIPYQIYAQNVPKPPETSEADPTSHVPVGNCIAQASSSIRNELSYYAIMCRASVAGTYKSIVIDFPVGYDVSGTDIEVIDKCMRLLAPKTVLHSLRFT
jgi:hypothetical protein